MGKTYRKDGNDNKFRESLKKKKGRYKCKCDYCATGTKRNKQAKCIEKELLEYGADG